MVESQLILILCGELPTSAAVVRSGSKVTVVPLRDAKTGGFTRLQVNGQSMKFGVMLRSVAIVNVWVIGAAKFRVISMSEKVGVFVSVTNLHGSSIMTLNDLLITSVPNKASSFRGCVPTLLKVAPLT